MTMIPSIKCSEFDNIKISSEFFNSLKIFSEELIKYLRSFKQISIEYMTNLQLLDNNNEFNPDSKIIELYNIENKIKEVINQNIDLMNCSMDAMETYINDFENILKAKEELINIIIDNATDLKNNLKSSYSEVNKTGNTFINSISKTENIIDNYYKNKEKIKSHENGLGDKLNIEEYNLLKEQVKIKINDMNNSIKLTKKYEEFHKGALDASDKLYEQFIKICEEYKNKIKKEVCEISNKIKDLIFYFMVSFKSIYNQPLNLIETYINELNNLDLSIYMNKSIDAKLLYDNKLKKIEPIKYNIKAIDDFCEKKNIEENGIKGIKILDDENLQKLYYISDDALMFTIKTLFNNFTLIEKRNFDIIKEENKNKTQRYIMKIIQNMNSYPLNIINNNRNDLSQKEINELINLLESHDNRVIFLQKLSDFRVKGKYILSDKDFIILSQLFNIICDNIKKYSDYHCAELIIILSQTYYTIDKKSKNKIYIQSSFKKNILFTQKDFWEKYLSYSINKEIIKLLKIESITNENEKNSKYKYSNVAYTQIMTLIDIMFEFDIDLNSIKEILEPKINEYILDNEFKTSIDEVILNREENRIKSLEKEKENNENIINK